ncbi:MAG TPA: TAT-variant-translocated molybdopterin oxidoreductase [Verrucomicrobiae bacterium]|jgi:molybdopterin-containing oxidoreductase family iron-sulfur binding subunit|nr:TAT-variant-translocated molybdopterin oxidoreductase [Verrucomicrobiae bacterium]
MSDDPKGEIHSLDLAGLRKRLEGLAGERYWRGLEELAGNDAFEELLRKEFPQQTSAWANGLDRRDFLKLMGASLALAGLGGCGRAAPPDEKIVPYVKQPEGWVPGKPLFYATAFTHNGAATGLLVRSHEGRPVKIEGNPAHPDSLGATDAFAQASILTLYDPDRSQVVSSGGAISTWNAFFTALDGEIEGQRLNGGTGLRILTEHVISPTLADQLRSILARFPRAKWHQYEPAGRDSVRAGARLAFGEYVAPQYRFDAADVIVALDADFLSCGGASLRWAREFAARRRVRGGKGEMSRLYAIESTPTTTGSVADHRLPLRPSEISLFAGALAGRLGPSANEARKSPATGSAQWLEAVARDLQNHRGRSIVIAGDAAPPFVHASAHAINQALGNVGITISYTQPVEAEPVDGIESLRELVKDIEAGQVSVLMIIGGNPVFTAPADIRFDRLLSRVAFSVHLSLYDDETSASCRWHVPEAHYLEAWSDTRASNGTATIVQPLIAPLYGGKSAHELLSAVRGQPGRPGYEIVRDYWQRQSRGDFESFWRKSLHDGVIEGTAFAAKAVKAKPVSSPESQAGNSPATNKNAETRESLEIIFRPDPTIFDGRFANNGWLQELPKPLTKITWDNAVLVSPATAERLGLTPKIGTTGGERGRVFADMVELTYAGRKIRAPAWIAPGHADGAATVYLGYGRARAGRVGTGTGFNMYTLRTADAPWQSAGLVIQKTEAQYAIACTQYHHNMEGRDLVRSAALEEYRKHPDFARDKDHPAETLYPGFQYAGYAWGMAIDTSACIGCNACVIACQAENNIPVVGKTEVTRGREMHWLRIDRYYKGDPNNPETFHQPLPCMHCEQAPCEIVCPVGATTHSDEGLNEMTYNRCVGTRYCSNNCPYKVRRFNFLQYSDFETPSLKLLHNPNVTVRSRGVMEKCTYCVQRINAARIDAEKDDRRVRDGEIRTACQAACPAEAIVFGDINDRSSNVAKLKADSLNYGLLTELNTRPRTTYLATVRNPNPDLKKT